MRYLRRLFRHGRHRIDYTSVAAIDAALNMAETAAYLSSIANGE